jgi:hypothetical protein
VEEMIKRNRHYDDEEEEEDVWMRSSSAVLSGPPLLHLIGPRSAASLQTLGASLTGVSTFWPSWTLQDIPKILAFLTVGDGLRKVFVWCKLIFKCKEVHLILQVLIFRFQGRLMWVLLCYAMHLLLHRTHLGLCSMRRGILGLETIDGSKDVLLPPAFLSLSYFFMMCNASKYCYHHCFMWTKICTVHTNKELLYSKGLAMNNNWIIVSKCSL